MKSSSETQFLRLFVPQQKSIYAYILAMVHDYVEAEDILQETSVVMWQKFREYRQGTDFTAWAITIARYQVLKYRKLRARSKVQFNDALLHAITECMASQLPDVDRRLQALRHCRRKLPERDRALIAMKYDQGVPFKEIAKKTGKSMHAIYKKMARIQDALLKCIDQALHRTFLPE